MVRKQTRSFLHVHCTISEDYGKKSMWQFHCVSITYTSITEKYEQVRINM